MAVLYNFVWHLYSDDVVRSATPGSVRQARVVQHPDVDDYEPLVKATKEQNQLYDLVKRYGDARSNSRATKDIRKYVCYSSPFYFLFGFQISFTPSPSMYIFVVFYFSHFVQLVFGQNKDHQDQGQPCSSW